MPHLSELHGAATHLGVVAIPLFALLHFVRRAGRGGGAVIAAEPWALGAAVVGVAASGATGLLVWGQAQTTLRGEQFRLGDAHFWLGIAIAVLAVLTAADWWRSRRRRGVHHRPVIVPTISVVIVVGVVVQGFLGGRMTYEHGVGVYDVGGFAQTARGASALHVAEAHGSGMVQAGKDAFSVHGLGCAACHGARAQGLRAPRLAGGRAVADFRSVHQHGLFPTSVVTDRDFAAIDAYLQTLGPPGGGD